MNPRLVRKCQTSHRSQIGILRYNAGNAESVRRALARLGIPAAFVETEKEILETDGLIFPGAGAASSAMNDLRGRKLVDVLRHFRKPFLGLCLGMQLLFEHSEEGDTTCLGIIPGNVQGLPDSVIKPHMGWNKLNTGEYVYFVHGYVCQPTDVRAVTMTTWYGGNICAGVRRKNFFGLQWHPEKSGIAGDEFLLSFAMLCR